AGWARLVRLPGQAGVWAPPLVGLLLLWPATWSGHRFVLPPPPLLLAYAAQALRDAARPLRWPPAARVAPLAAGALLLLLALPGLGKVEAVGRTCRTLYRE